MKTHRQQNPGAMSGLSAPFLAVTIMLICTGSGPGILAAPTVTDPAAFPVLLTAESALASANPLAQIVYSHDFESPVSTEWSRQDRDTTPVGARTFLGQFGSESVTLTLGALPSHDFLSIRFDLFVIRSWGGNAEPFGIDEWTFGVAGEPLTLDTTFSNSPDDPTYGTQAYPGSYPGGAHPAWTGASEGNTLGYTFQSVPVDSVYRLVFNIPHTASSVQFVFSFLAPDQGLDDESWGIDNIKVEARTGALAAGRVPAGAPYVPLLLTRLPGGDILLDWEESCVDTDTDYAVYEGLIGDFTSHAQRLCSTGGLSTATLTPAVGSRYYLVVPSSGSSEGSYGLKGNGMERPASLSAACLPQLIEACD